MTTRPDVRRAAAEAVGTYFLVLIGPGAAMVNAHTGGVIGHAGVALAFAFVVLALVYALGHLSGAHINPAVTLAFWSARRFPGRDVPAYILAQCVGAIAASLTLRSVLGSVGQLGATVPTIPVGAAFAVEWLLSFILMFVIASVATDERVADGFAGIAVGLTVGFDAMMGGPLTGASMNPARSLGPAVAGGFWTAHWIYWLAPISAMMIAARVYDALRPAQAAAVPPRRIAVGAEGPIRTRPAGLMFKHGDSRSPRSNLTPEDSHDVPDPTTPLHFGARVRAHRPDQPPAVCGRRVRTGGYSRSLHSTRARRGPPGSRWETGRHQQ